MIRGYRNHARIIDPMIGTVLGVALLLPVDKVPASEAIFSGLPGSRSAVYGALATIFGSLLGFSIASLAIVVTVVRLPGMRFLRRAPSAGKVWSTFHSTIRWLAFGTVASLAALVFDTELAPRHLLTAIVAFGTITSALRLTNSIWVLEDLVTVAVRDESKDDLK